jgi:hypothetical protein
MKGVFYKRKGISLFLLRITQQCSFSLFGNIRSLDELMVTVKKTRGVKSERENKEPLSIF